MKTLISIGIPVKNEVGNIPVLRSQITNLINADKYSNFEFEVLVNDNLSTDGSGNLLDDWSKSDSRVKTFHLLKPLEFQATISNLMSKAEGEAFALYQSDLQDPIEILEKLLDTWMLDNTYIVVGRVSSKDEFFFVYLLRRIFYFLLDVSSDKNYISGFQDFYVLPKYVYSHIASLPVHNMFIRGYLNYSFTQIKFIEYRRINRTQGKSKFNFFRMYDLALDGLLLYGRNFIRILSIASFLMFCVSLTALLSILTLAAIGFDPGVKGWMSIACGVAIMLSMFGVVAGVLLEYLIRIHRILHLTETKHNLHTSISAQ